jgi:hypothetical protein
VTFLEAGDAIALEDKKISLKNLDKKAIFFFLILVDKKAYYSKRNNKLKS